MKKAGLQTRSDLRAEMRAIGRRLAVKMPRISGSSPADGPIQVVDLFCGAGGLSAGFELVGRELNSYRLAGAADYDVSSIATYARNLPIKPLQADLGLVSPELFAKKLRLDRSKPLVVLGGPPCQGFSAHRKKQSPRSDHRNSLIDAFTQISLQLKPEFIIFENVPEVTSKKHWLLFEQMRSAFRKHGYFVKTKIHNLAGFGVPQARFRTLLIAGKRPFEFPEPFLQPGQYRTVRDAIGRLSPIEPGSACANDPMHVCTNHRASTINVLKKVPKDGGTRPKGVGPRCLQEVDGFRDVYGRLYWDRPANTVTAFARNPASGRYAHPEQNRGLSIREAAVLQGFPPDYSFEGSFDGKFLQIGNAVPASFAAYLAAHILGELRSRDAVVWDPSDDHLSPSSNSFSSGIAGRKRAVR